MNYAYVRVSSLDQKLERQIDAIKKWQAKNKIEIHDIYKDKQSGKDFNREGYKQMKSKLQEGDLVVIKSIDRLGRNYDMIIEEWADITKKIKADIVVIDMPLLDTRSKEENLTGKFISDLVLQILSYVSETERRNIKIRQAEGIKLALANGVHFGRQRQYDDDFVEKVRIAYEDGMHVDECVATFGCSVRRIKVWLEQYNWNRAKHHENLLKRRKEKKIEY